jgi:TonB-dependent receptor
MINSKLRFNFIKYFILTLFFFLNGTLLAQNNSLRGKVTDIATGEGLPSATIRIVGTGLGTVADVYGNYILRNLPDGNHIIRISYVGYKTFEQTIQLSHSQSLSIDFKLTAESVTGQEVIVTAQARGQAEAINQQLQAGAIVNIVSSTKIQEVPTANAAEAVGKLPGVSILRSGGEGNQIVIRGLSPKFNNIQVAGIKMASTSSDNRSVDLSMISSYMLDGIEVVKAITPDMDADAIGGTVDFKLRQAPSSLRYDLMLQGGYNDIKNSYDDYKIVGNGSDRFLDNDLGLFVQFDIEKRNRNANSMGSGYELISPILGQYNPLNIYSLNLSDVFRVKERYGGTVVLDYNIPSGSIIFNNFVSYSNTEATTISESYQLPSTHNYTVGVSKTDLTVAINSLKYTQDLSILKIDLEASHSFSESKAPGNFSFDFTERSAFNAPPNRNIPPTMLPQYAVNNINNTEAGNLSYSERYSREQVAMGALNLTKGFTLTDYIAVDIKAGGKVNYMNRRHDLTSEGGFLNSGSGAPIKLAIMNAFFPEELADDKLGPNPNLLPYRLFIDNNYKHSTFLKGQYALGATADIELIKKVMDVIRACEPEGAYKQNVYNSITDDYHGSELRSAGFLMADFQWLNLVKLIVGARYEYEVRDYTAPSGNSTLGMSRDTYIYIDTTTNYTYGKLLPMIHLKIKPIEWFDIRFAYTNTLSRPDFIHIVPRINIGSDGISWSNYKLNPATSENYDLYLSFHENSLGLFTIGAFKKNITDMIFATNGKILLNPEEIGMPATEKNKALYTYINNPYKVNLWGIETSWQTNFWWLGDLFKGLVFDINYTHIFSEVNYPRTIVKSQMLFEPPWIIQTAVDTFYTARLINQPNDIVNVSLGYDYKGFSIYASMLFQSNIFSSTNFWEELRGITDDFYRYDISIKQELPLHGLQFFVNLTNVSRATDRNINQGDKFITSESFYGFGVDLGIRYRLR